MRLGSLFLALCMAALVGTLLLFVFLSSMLKSAVITTAQDIFGTTVTVEGATGSPFSGKAELYGITIDNPASYGGGKGITLASLKLEVSLKDLLWQDTITIQSAALGLPTFYYTQASTDENNLAYFLKNAQAFAQGAGSLPAVRRMRIDQLTIAQGKLVFKNQPPLEEETLTFSLPRIRAQDIGHSAAEGIVSHEVAGFSAAELTKEVIAPVLETYINIAHKKYRTILEDPENHKSTRAKAEEGAEKMGEALENAGKNIDKLWRDVQGIVD